MKDGSCSKAPRGSFWHLCIPTEFHPKTKGRSSFQRRARSGRLDGLQTGNWRTYCSSAMGSDVYMRCVLIQPWADRSENRFLFTTSTTRIDNGVRPAWAQLWSTGFFYPISTNPAEIFG